VPRNFGDDWVKYSTVYYYYIYYSRMVHVLGLSTNQSLYTTIITRYSTTVKGDSHSPGLFIDSTEDRLDQKIDQEGAIWIR